MPGSNDPVLEDTSLSVDGILDILSDENDAEEKEPQEEIEGKGKEKIGKKEAEPDDREPEGEDEEKVEKIELEEKDEDEEELQINRVSRKELLKAYPDLFKKFPSIEKSIYKEQQYAEIFPTMRDARESKEIVDTYRDFESNLLSGDISQVLNSVKNTDSRAFEKITETFLHTLSNVDKQAHAAILSQVLKGAAISMFSEGKSRENENLQLAAQILHEFAFGNSRITAYQFKHKVNEQPDERESQLREREQGFYRQQLDSAISDVSSRAENVIKGTIEKYIDPKGAMTSYSRSKAVDDAIEEVRSALRSDRSFSAVLDRLWERSMNEDFAEHSKSKIKNAVLSKAQTVLPEIIRKVRNEVLKGHTSVRAKKNEDEETEIVEKPSKSVQASTKSTNSGKSKDGRGMKTADFFMQD